MTLTFKTKPSTTRFNFCYMLGCTNNLKLNNGKLGQNISVSCLVEIRSYVSASMTSRCV